jgi:hypothetical protein
MFVFATSPRAYSGRGLRKSPGFAGNAAVEPEVLAHHFTQAGLTDAAIEWWGKAGDQALRPSAFQEAISHLGEAIEMADRTGATRPQAGADNALTDKRVTLQTSYARAVMWSRGFGNAEMKTAFSRAQALAVDSDSPDERFNIYYGLWFASLARGELAFASEHPRAFDMMRNAVGERQKLGLRIVF